MDAPREVEFQPYLDAAPDALLIVGPDGRILHLNRHAAELFGYHHDELTGTQVEVLLPERFRERHRAHRAGYHEQPRTRPMGAGLDLYGRCKDGTEVPVDISLGPVDTAQGTVIVAAVRDATERRQAEETSRELAAAQQRRRQALELNDGVVQGLTAAKLAIELGDVERAEQLLTDTLDNARALVRELLDHPEDAARASGELQRSRPAIVQRDEP